MPDFLDEDTPVMLMDPTIEIAQLKAQLATVRHDRDVLTERNLAYELTLKQPLGHLVELLASGVAWRDKAGPAETERLKRAIDAARAEETSRKKP